MKKIAILGLALAMMGLATASFAALNQTFRVTVIVVSPGVSIARMGTGDVGFGTLATDTTGNFLDRVIFQNDGLTTSDWALSATAFETLSAQPSNWTFLTTAPGGATGVNQVRLAGVWDVWNFNLTRTIADFGAEDTLTTTPVESSLTVFGVDTNADPLVKGFNVPATQQGSLWLSLDTPSAGSDRLTEMVVTTITVAASAH